jgi:hypothetical protein
MNYLLNLPRTKHHSNRSSLIVCVCVDAATICHVLFIGRCVAADVFACYVNYTVIMLHYV